MRQQVGKQGMDAEAERESMTDEVMTEFTVEELREFLQGDILDVQVDPAFKERLKRRLWELVKEQARRREDPDDA
jgi:hypothetical protein